MVAKPRIRGIRNYEARVTTARTEAQECDGNMFANFHYAAIPLSEIQLDDRNPRIVTQQKLASQDAIVVYLFEHERLGDFIKKIVFEGKNKGAERPYVVKIGKAYTVIEGNTRIAAYKLLTGQLLPPSGYASAVPAVSKAVSDGFLMVDCSMAPSRDALLPIMANSHFGLGDKSKWGYLGSRKAVFDEWKSGKTVAQLAKAFDRTKGQINDLIIEYEIYLEAISLSWTKDENTILLDPSVEFNPPVRFLQTRGHKGKLGISYDKANLKINFENDAGKRKFRHLISKLVINPEQGLGATALYEEVFADFDQVPNTTAPAQNSEKGTAPKPSGTATGATGRKGGSAGTQAKPGTLFAYPITINNALLVA